MLSVLLTLFLTPQDQPPQGGPQAVEILSLHSLCGPRTGVTPPPWGTLLTYTDAESRQPDLCLSRDDLQSFDPDVVLELLRSQHAEAVDNGTLQLHYMSGSLRVAGPAPTVALVANQFRGLSQQITRALQVEVVWWDAGSGPAPAGVLGPREYAQFAEQHRALWRSHAAARSGMPVALDQQRWTRYVRDVSVEVAQKAHIAYANTDAFGEGGRVVVVPHSLVGGDDLVVHVQFGLGARRGEVASVPTGISEQADLDVPTLETVFGSCSARLVNGGALCVSTIGHAAGGGNRVLTVRVRSKTPPIEGTGAPVAALPISALTSAALTQRVTPPDPYPAIGDREPARQEVQEEQPGYGHVATDDLLEHLRSSLGEGADEQVQLNVGCGCLFVRADAATIGKVEASLRQLQDRMLRNTTVRHSGTLTASEGTAPATLPLHELVLPTLLGRLAMVSRMLETNVLRDVQVEIAQESTATNPQIEVLQLGTWLRACVTPQDDGMHLQMLAQCAQGEVTAPRRIAPAGALSLPSVASTRTPHDGAVASGQAIEHGDGPTVRIDGRPYRSALVTSVTW